MKLLLALTPVCCRSGMNDLQKNVTPSAQRTDGVTVLQIVDLRPSYDFLLIR